MSSPVSSEDRTVDAGRRGARRPLQNITMRGGGKVLVSASTADNDGVGDAQPRLFPQSIYSPEEGTVLMGRYRVAQLLGRGTYGTVVRAEDLFTASLVAIKVLHKGDTAYNDLHIEEKIYTQLVLGCSPSVQLFAEVLGDGDFDGYHCTIFECCQMTLYQLLMGTDDLLPLPRRQVKEMAFQIIQGIAYMHSLGLIHTDIKPNNIALRYGRSVNVKYFEAGTGFCDRRRLVSTQICILDLGGTVADVEDGFLGGMVGALGYRAPEISLGIPWNRSVDVFAIGCVIAELYLSQHLFPSVYQTGREHLAMIERMVGSYPFPFAAEVEAKYPGTFRLDESSASVIFPPAEFNKDEHAGALVRLRSTKPLSVRVHDSSLNDVLRRLMNPDPRRRVVLDLVLKHKYFDELRLRNVT